MKNAVISGLTATAIIMFFLSVHAAYGFGQTGERGYLENGIITGMACLVSIVSSSIIGSLGRE